MRVYVYLTVVLASFVVASNDYIEKELDSMFGPSLTQLIMSFLPTTDFPDRIEVSLGENYRTCFNGTYSRIGPKHELNHKDLYQHYSKYKYGHSPKYTDYCGYATNLCYGIPLYQHENDERVRIMIKPDDVYICLQCPECEILAPRTTKKCSNSQCESKSLTRMMARSKFFFRSVSSNWRGDDCPYGCGDTLQLIEEASPCTRVGCSGRLEELDRKDCSQHPSGLWLFQFKEEWNAQYAHDYSSNMIPLNEFSLFSKESWCLGDKFVCNKTFAEGIEIKPCGE